ncbi:hypothetical protein TRFO_37155 [Tritrichomonas foetus]|uniref:Uncharacterized protein n=1 Tax=Tritrichomonas foetus TaxID=1144522 RepID=A0A1J4JG60_9EUKA|nr:hypothetical protein TRFO_37155 [Tritrichomonas foetus]|eukprot:OHS96635.1 hypothetical protein TRFO_37155 [Tritrichomonas foetus]
MRINRENTLIEDNSYPLAGMHEEDICNYLTTVLKPYEPFFNQFQAAVLLHNVPLYITILLISFVFLYTFKIIVDSEFPTIFFLIALYPMVNLILLIGGQNVLTNLCIEIPELPESAPDRVRPIHEIIQIVWKPLIFTWRAAFFAYRTFLCPNIVDIIVFLAVVIISGLLLCVLDGLLILSILVAICLIFPPLLTREVVYAFLMAHLGHPFPEKEEELEEYYGTHSKVE